MSTKVILPIENRPTLISNTDSNINQEFHSSEKHFNLQKNLDEKIANNMLKLNMVLFLFTIILSVMFVLYSSTIFFIEPIDRDKSEYSIVSFSLIDFTIYEKNNTSIYNTYSCVKNKITCENNCRSIDLHYIMTNFEFECHYFSDFFIAGLVVLIILI